ncbi:MAG TPA: SRPBCC family protein [Bryobacteraceae bacterium]|jgi:uncharacterized membrane protein|nr:SRPBCC family protein [Bryobacteraceae bacterium]
MATDTNNSSKQLANGLGWFSIGLGVAELATPNLVAKLIGVNDGSTTKKILRSYGARELAAGVGILYGSNPSGWLWARVAGDVLDLSSLVKAMTSDDNKRGRAIAATAAVVGVTVADVRCAMQLANSKSNQQNGRSSTMISSSIIIGRNVDEVYGFWRNFNRLPEILDRLEAVQTLDDKRSHWKLSLPLGRTLEWDAEITHEQPNSRIAWRSVSASVPHSGEVRFEPAAGGRGTKVTVEIRPEGHSTIFAKPFALAPEQHVIIALHNLKQLLETGEIIKSDASIHRGIHAAQPPADFPAGNNGLRSAAAV